MACMNYAVSNAALASCDIRLYKFLDTGSYLSNDLLPNINIY